MTKLNLSALKKQAGNPSPKVWEEIIASSVPVGVSTSKEASDAIMTAGNDLPPTLDTKSATPSTVSSVVSSDPFTPVAVSSVVSSEPFTAVTVSPIVISEPSTPVTVREFFPNLTLSTKYEMDEILTTTSETQSTIMSEWAVVATDMPPSIFPLVEVISQKPIQKLTSESVPLEVSAIETWMDPIYVQSVAEDLSKVREWGLKRFSSRKKVALVSISGMIVCAGVVAWLYSFWIFPASKASVMETPIIVAVTPPIIIPVNTGAINTWSVNTGAILPVTSTEITTSVFSGSSISASGSATSLSWAILSSTGSTVTSTGGVLTTTSTGTLLPSTATGTNAGISSNIVSWTGSTTSWSGTLSNTWSIFTPIKPSETNTFTGTTASTVRTPNIRVPRTK